ncbi:MAG: HAD hydrolase-like protein [Phascolarctobacterium succinatutens]|uniref:HAD hydrolase-like protein n=1 Tax=Phascolarctobacterium succinatutens TaxID=626940 RepID=UPI003994D06A
MTKKYRLYAAFSVFLLLQLSNFRVKPEECLCVGDSPFDLQSGRSAGTKTVAVRYTAFGWEKLLEEGRPDFVIVRPQELLEIVGKIH